MIEPLAAFNQRFRQTQTVFQLPDLFREGKGVVAQGSLGPDGVFRATEVLAKHDENYMPPDAKAAIDSARNGSTTGTSMKSLQAGSGEKP